ncbi:MAG: hypothetical protein ACP5IO_00395 [Elusimicrobiales bacterium]
MSENENYIHERISKLAKDIENYLATLPLKTATSWEIKTNFKISSSIMYMAVGKLLSENRIKISSENLIYKITLLAENLSSDAKTLQ